MWRLEKLPTLMVFFSPSERLIIKWSQYHWKIDKGTCKQSHEGFSSNYFLAVVLPIDGWYILFEISTKSSWISKNRTFWYEEQSKICEPFNSLSLYWILKHQKEGEKCFKLLGKVCFDVLTKGFLHWSTLNSIHPVIGFDITVLWWDFKKAQVCFLKVAIQIW